MCLVQRPEHGVSCDCFNHTLHILLIYCAWLIPSVKFCVEQPKGRESRKCSPGCSELSEWAMLAQNFKDHEGSVWSAKMNWGSKNTKSVWYSRCFAKLGHKEAKYDYKICDHTRNTFPFYEIIFKKNSNLLFVYVSYMWWKRLTRYLRARTFQPRMLAFCPVLRQTLNLGSGVYPIKGWDLCFLFVSSSKVSFPSRWDLSHRLAMTQGTAVKERKREHRRGEKK